MDYLEEQTTELEALESIYPDELQILEPQGSKPCFKILISNQTASDEEDNAAFILVQFTYTEKYPDEAPLMEITGSDNVEDDELEKLTKIMDEQAEENLGMVMVFTIVSALLENLGNMVEDRMKRKEEEAERKRIAQEAAELARFEGTRVTIDSFLAWKAKFDTELEETKRLRGETLINNKKLTGKELFMRDTSLDDSDVKFLQEDGGAVEVDESLFQDLDDLDLDAEGLS